MDWKKGARMTTRPSMHALTMNSSALRGIALVPKVKAFFSTDEEAPYVTNTLLFKSWFKNDMRAHVPLDCISSLIVVGNTR